MLPQTRAARIRLMAFDVDGVMTGGGITYDEQGGEIKTFNVMDGLGLRLLSQAGIEAAIVTGRRSRVVAARAADLGILHVHQGVLDKGRAMTELLAQLQIPWHETAFMGDDLIDLPAMLRCGFAIAPANAHPQVKERAHLLTRACGGQGAVREAIEFVLAAQNKLETLITSYLDPSTRSEQGVS